MAKLRTNHAREGKMGNVVLRIGLFAALLLGLFVVARLLSDTYLQEELAPALQDKLDDRSYYLPTSTTGQVVSHTHFTLSYAEPHEQAEWVAFILTRERLQLPRVERTNRFTEDPLVKTGSATWYDYRGSGFDRGHLAAAADMSFDQVAMEESFLMSNISPQERAFNHGIWRELEELTRDWARKFIKLYVVTGPVLTLPVKKYIGKNEVSVPAAYYKVLLDLSEPELKGIGFLIPNEISEQPLADFAVSIDSVETLTGINFFPQLMTSELESSLEKKFDIKRWPFSAKKFELRVKRWNKE
ncbi:MAG: DNA/RNA non-specific endonuclease [Lewinellaceae bacterium]|nr:DNA/RNA non-specific endonuclease [Lewinellaceae bacterium]